MNWRGPFFLALILFVLGSFAYWMEYKHKPMEENQAEQAKKLFSFKEKQIHEVKLGVGKKVFAVKCLDLKTNGCKPGDNSKWELAEPMKVRADDTNVNSLVSTLNNITAAETIGLKEESPEKRAALLKEYGLDPVSLATGRRVEVNTSTGYMALYLGQTHPIGESIFALKAEGTPGKVNEETVYLVPNYFKTNFDKELTHWRDKKLVSLAPQEVHSFSLESEKGNVAGLKADGQWTLTVKGEQYTGDVENVESFLAGAHYLSAKDFVSDDKTGRESKAQLRGTKPVLKLELNQTLLTLFRKGKAGRLFATVSNMDPLFELDPSAVDRLNKDLKDLRMVKFMTSMERFTAKKLEFVGTPVGPAAIELSNVDGKWQTRDKKAVDSEKVQKILDKLSSNRIKEFVTGKKIPGGESDGLRVTIGDEKNPKKRQIVFWKKDGKLFARDLLSKRAEAFLVDTTVADDLPWNSNFFAPSEAVKK